MSITEISIKRPTLIVVIFTVLTFLGIMSYNKLNYELLPKYSEPILIVMTNYPGASPSEVENSVTKKIEDAVSSVEDIDNIKSTSYEGASVSIIFFKTNANMDKALRVTQNKINAIESSLPAQVLRPIVSDFSMSDIPVIRIGVTSSLTSTELYDMVCQKIQPMFSRIQGVGRVTIIGGEEREIKVNVDRSKLDAYKVSLLQITQALQNSNIDFPTGKISNPEQQTVIRLSGKFQSLDDIRNLVVTLTRDGKTIKLKDLAEVEDSKKEARNINRINGLSSLGIMIQKTSDGNEVKISEAVMKTIASLEQINKSDKLKFAVANDTSDFTRESANAVKHDLLLAVLFVALVMLVFLHSFRNSFIILVAIPASLISCFIAMYIFKFSLNLMTLVALSLVIGILVDDSIVVLENIYRHLEMGKDRRIASLEGRQEIAFTALSITMVDVVVFLPIALVNSMISDILRQFALVVVVTTLLSLFVSFTVTPLLASRMAKIEKFRKNSFLAKFINRFDGYIKGLNNTYAGVLVWALRHKAAVFIVATVLLLISFGLVGTGFIGSEFVSAGDRGEMIIALELPKNATLEQTNKVTLEAENILLHKPEIVKVFTSVGAVNDFMGNSGIPYKSELHIKLIDKNKRDYTAEQYAQKIKNELTVKLSGVKVRSNIVSMVGTSDYEPIQLVMTGTNMDTLLHYAQVVMKEVEKVKGTAEVKMSVEGGNPEINVQIDKQKMAELGLSMEIVGATMQNAFSGNKDSKFRTGNNEFDINIQLDAFDRKNINDVSSLSFINRTGEVIRLNQFATISPSTGTTVLERQNRVSCVTVTSTVVGRPEGTVGKEIKKRLEKVSLPKDVSVSDEGNLKFQSEAFGNMYLAFMISILFVYLVMVALYNSYMYPFVVLFSIPLAIIGALFALALTMQSLSIFSLLGIIMLVGLVGKNAILLVDFTNQLKEKGYSTVHALVKAGKVRLRPILMTTMSMIVGMLPIALAKGAGAEWKNGMAWALIGGLTSSLLLTLIIVPVVYLVFDSKIQKIQRWFKRKSVLTPSLVD